MKAQWDPNWYPIPLWGASPALSIPGMPDATPWALGGNQVVTPQSFNGHFNYSCGTLDGAPFALKASGVDCIYMDQSQRVAIGPNHMPSINDCQLDIQGSGSNLRIYGNTDGYIESTSHMRLFYNNFNVAGTANFQVNQGTPTNPTPRFNIDGNGYTSIYQDLRVGSPSWLAAGRLIVDGLTKNGMVIRSDNGFMAMNICNNSGVGKFMVKIDAGGGDNAQFRLVGRTQIGFYQNPTFIIDPTTQVNVDAFNVHGVKVSTNNLSNKMFFVDYNGNCNFEVKGNGATHIGPTRPSPTGVASQALLTVDGMILARDIRVSNAQNTHWPDYVFEENYKLMPLTEVQSFITTFKHLPDVPSEAEVKTDGVDLLDMNIKLLQKLEELYLHTIALKDQVDKLEVKLKNLTEKQTGQH